MPASRFARAPTAHQTEAAVAGALVGCQGQDLYRAEKKRYPPAEVQWAGSDEATIAIGQVLGESVNLTRRLVNEPPDILYPESFANRAAEIAEGTGIEFGTKRGWKRNGAARCWRWRAARRIRRGW
jgi:leucyl aminopeptidase